MTQTNKTLADAMAQTEQALSKAFRSSPRVYCREDCDINTYGALHWDLLRDHYHVRIAFLLDVRVSLSIRENPTGRNVVEYCEVDVAELPSLIELAAHEMAKAREAFMAGEAY